MPKYIFTNNATSVLTMDHPAGSVVINLPTGEGALFPAPVAANDEIAMITLEDRRSGQMELCKCTQRSGDTLTVERGQEGTAAQTFVAGALVSNRLTAGAMAAIQTGSFTIGDASFVNYVPGVAPLTTVSVKAELDTQRTKDNSQDAAITAETNARVAADASINTAVGTKVSKSGDTMTGLLVLSADPSAALGAATKQYADLRVLKSGDTMSGPLSITAVVSANLHAATKQYVDIGDGTALKITSNLSDLNNVTTARSNLGLVIGTNVQAYDADLAAIAALTSAANKLLYATGANAWALADLTLQARQLLDDTSFASMLSTLGIGNVENKSANTILAELPAVRAHRSGSGTVALTNGAWTKINLSTIATNNPAGAWVITGSSLIVPRAGVYLINAVLGISTLPTTINGLVGIGINGGAAVPSPVAQTRYANTGAGSVNVGLCVPYIAQLAAGDSIELAGFSSGAGAIATDAQISTYITANMVAAV